MQPIKYYNNIKKENKRMLNEIIKNDKKHIKTTTNHIKNDKKHIKATKSI